MTRPTISLDGAAYDLLKKHCEETGRSMSSAVEEMIHTATTTRPWRCVVIETPLRAADPERAELHALYLRACMRHCLLRGDAPFASHKLYVGPLDDEVPEERRAGIDAGFAWRKHAEATVVYVDLGISIGMRAGVRDAILRGSDHKVAVRSIMDASVPNVWSEEFRVRNFEQLNSAHGIVYLREQPPPLEKIMARCHEVLSLPVLP